MAPCGYFTTNHDGIIVRVNRTMLDWLGYDSSELIIGKRVVDLLTVGGRIFYETHFNLLLRVQSTVDEIALDLVRKDGRILPALINARQKRSAEGQPLLNRFTVFNSTERRLYERRLLAARDLLQTTLASIGDGVVVTDASGQITFLNPVAEILTGWTADAALGKSIEEVLILRREGTGRSVENPVTVALRRGVAVALENHTVLFSRDGREIPIDDSASPIRDPEGELVGAVLVFRDISAQRIAEKALQDANEELEQRAADLRRSNEDLSEFAHVVSHDLRSPLNTILGFAELIEQRHGEELGEGKKLLNYLRSAATRMRTLIEDMLSYAKVTAGSQEMLTPVDANEPAQMAIGNLQIVIQKSEASVTFDPLPIIKVPATGLVQIFQNLVANAIHYRGSDTPRIHISAVSHDQDWLFSCRDNGMGIAPSYHSKIFEPFKRLHGPDRPGSGVGLAVCKRIVERAGGTIWVESQEGHGATFFFTIPRHS